MRTIKIHLENEAYEPVIRLAHQFHVHPEDIVLAGLNRIMKDTEVEGVREEVADVISCRKHSLPCWADHAHEIHAYESK